MMVTRLRLTSPQGGTFPGSTPGLSPHPTKIAKSARSPQKSATGPFLSSPGSQPAAAPSLLAAGPGCCPPPQPAHSPAILQYLVGSPVPSSACFGLPDYQELLQCRNSVSLLFVVYSQATKGLSHVCEEYTHPCLNHFRLIFTLLMHSSDIY